MIRYTESQLKHPSNLDNKGNLFANKRPLSRYAIILFLLLTIYMVLPLIDIPLMGLSLSAPIFFIIVIEAFFRARERWFNKYRLWIFLAIITWLGILISAVGNGLLSNGVNIDFDGILTVVRFGYWLLVFVVSVFVVSSARLFNKVGLVLGIGMAILVCLRLYEAVVWGSIGAGSETRFLTQNSYGFYFSSFSIYLIAGYFAEHRWKKIIAGCACILLVLAIAINGSRGSWFGVVASFVVFALLFTYKRKSQAVQLIMSSAIIVGLAVGLMLSNSDVSRSLLSRYSTLESLDNDKSYAVRRLMNQKGLKLFLNSPILGIGPNRFRQSSIPLEMPDAISYFSYQRFDTKSAHNSYIAFLSETGLVGSIPFAIILAILAIRGLFSSMKLANEFSVYPIAIYASFIGMSVHMWSISTLTNTSVWFVYGLVGAMISFVKLSNSSKNPGT